jgi:hypothetical protein
MGYRLYRGLQKKYYHAAIIEKSNRMFKPLKIPVGRPEPPSLVANQK